MSIPSRGIKRKRSTLLAICFWLLVWAGTAPSARAINQSGALHWSGNKTVWDRKKNSVKLYGDAIVTQPGESLTADFIVLDLDRRRIDAKGNCVYTALDSIIYAEEIHFSLETGVGSIVGGKVTNGRFMLIGERINKLGDGRFQTHRGEYTSCHDCPGSWSLLSEDVDMQIDGYAYLTNVTGKIKDTPVMWMPYMVLPMKSRRQSGLLFPKIGTSTENGFIYVQPYFWAISRSADMTFAIGTYSERGRRFEWEGRYILSDRSGGTANFYYLQDNRNDVGLENRWGFKLQQTQELFWGIDQKLRIFETSDSLFPVKFDDIPGRQNPVLVSDLSFSRASPDVSAFLTARRFRNLLNFDNPTQFDSSTVQLYPQFEATSNDRFLWGSPVATGVTLGVSNFWRPGEAFDRDCLVTGTCDSPLLGYQPGVDPLRRGTRFSVTPTLYTTARPFDVLTLIPSVEYRSYYYNFYNEVSDLNRGFLLFQTELSTQFEKIYDTDDPDIPKVKHLIRPSLKYSRIPYRYEPDHPFINQVRYRSGYNFDNNDIVPYSTSPSLENYTIPIGHSISYGVTTQLIRREGKLSLFSPGYQRFIELSAGQTLNFLEFNSDSSTAVPLSRFYSLFSLGLKKVGVNIQYYYYPYLSRLLPNADPNELSPHQVSTSARYTMESAVHQDILSFERSLGLTYSWKALGSSKTSKLTGDVVYSLSDYIMPALNVGYNFLGEKTSEKLADLGGSLTFQSPSRCWKFSFGFSISLDRGLSKSFDLSLNLTGDGFGGVTQLANTVQTGAN